MSKDIAETIEFFAPPHGLDISFYIDTPLPGDASEKQKRLRKQAIHHLARYHWACRVLEKSEPGTVLDVACGGGYGSSLLAQRLLRHKVVGGDYDERAVFHARSKYGGLPNLEFNTLDLETWTSADGRGNSEQFKYIVSFDTIEHILHRDVALINMVENLTADGMLIFSTPCKRNNILKPSWEHHKIEYSCEFLLNLLKRFFHDVLQPQDDGFPEIDFWNETVNRGEVRYLLRANPLVCRRPIQFGLRASSESNLK